MGRVPLSDVADALLEHPDPVATAPELADELGCSRRHMGDRLDVLEMEGIASSKKVGGRARVWWHQERVTPARVAPEEHPAQSDLRDHSGDAGPPERDVGRDTDAEEASGPADSAGDAQRDVGAQANAGPVRGVSESPLETSRSMHGDIQDIDLPGEGDVLDDRRAAVRAAVDLLRDRGTAEKQDFLSDVRPDHPAGFDSDRGWWNAIGIQGLGQLADRRDDLQKPSPGASQWRWTGDDDASS